MYARGEGRGGRGRRSHGASPWAASSAHPLAIVLSVSDSPPVIEGEKNMSKDKKSEITEAIRDRLSSGTIGTRHRIGRCRSRRGTTGDEHGTPLTDPCGCSSTGNGKADAAGVRSPVERNDFYCQECNTHK